MALDHSAAVQLVVNGGVGNNEAGLGRSIGLLTWSIGAGARITSSLLNRKDLV